MHLNNTIEEFRNIDRVLNSVLMDKLILLKIHWALQRYYWPTTIVLASSLWTLPALTLRTTAIQNKTRMMQLFYIY